VKKSLRDIVFVFTVFVISRVFVAFGVFLGRKFLSFAPAFHDKVLESAWWESLVRWDANFFTDVAINGYLYLPDGKTHNVGFFPLYPLLIRTINYFWKLPPTLIGIAVSNAFFLMALFLLYRYTKKYHPDSDPDLTTILMAFFPLGVFFSSIYSESLFLFLCLSSFFMFRKGKMIAAACALFFVSMTRLAGIFVVGTIGWSYVFGKIAHSGNKGLDFKWRELVTPLFWVLFSVSGCLLFLAYQQYAFGHWDAFILGQKAFHRHPIGSFSALLSEMNLHPFNIMNLLPTGAVLGTSIIFLFLKDYRSYSLWGLLAVAVPLSTGTFLSMSRYSMVFFPLVIYGSSLLTRIPLLRDITIMACSAALVIFTALFVRIYFLG